MKLKLEYLTPYLPYRLRFYDALHRMTHNIVGVIENEIYAKDDNGDCYSWCYEELDELPILRPLADLVKEDYSHLLYGNPLEYKIDELPYKTFIKLLEWHFDVFHLIPQGLAIDINTLAQ